MNNFYGFQNFRQFSTLFSQIWLKKRHTSLFSGICREIRTKFHQKFAEKCKIRWRNWKKSENQLFNREKNLAIFDENFVYFFTQTDPTRTVQRFVLCWSRRELSHTCMSIFFRAHRTKRSYRKIRKGRAVWVRRTRKALSRKREMLSN